MSFAPFADNHKAVFFILGVHAQIDSSQHNHPAGFGSLKKDDDDGEDYGDIDDDNYHILPGMVIIC